MRLSLRVATLSCLALAQLRCSGTSDLSGSEASPSASTGSSTAATPSASGDGASGENFSSSSLASLLSGATPSTFAIALAQNAPDGTQLCVDVRDQGRDNGTRLQLWACADSDNQKFTVSGNLVKVYKTKCLNVVDGKNADGTAVQIWDCSSNDRNMLWDASGGHLRWKGTDKCLDATDGRFENGAALQIWTCNETSANQTFAFRRPPSSSSAAGGASSSNGAGTGTAASSSSTGTGTVSNGATLDVSTWQQEVHAAYAFNNEQQNYTDGGRNVAFRNGVATLTARPTGGNGWTSARLSGDEMGQLPWYLEADIAAPTGKGSWPAFWLTARSSWPQGGEIDVMEQVNGDGQTHISTHWGQQTGNATFNTHEAISDVNGAARHRYGVWVTDQGLQFYLDGKAVGSWVTFPAAANFSSIAAKMVPIVNVAMGGDWPGYAPQATGEQTMVVYAVTRAPQPPN